MNTEYNLKYSPLLELRRHELEHILKFTDKTSCVRLIATSKAFGWLKTDAEKFEINFAFKLWSKFLRQDYSFEKIRSFYRFTDCRRSPYVRYKELSQYIYPHVRPVKIRSAMERLPQNLSRSLFLFCDSRDFSKLILLSRDFCWLRKDDRMWKRWLLDRFPSIEIGLAQYPKPHPKGLPYQLLEILGHAPSLYDSRRYPPWTQEFLLEGHTGIVTSVAVGFFNQLVVSGSEDRTVRAWYPRTDRTGTAHWDPVILTTHDTPVTTVSVNLAGTTVASGSQSGVVEILERNGKEWTPTRLTFPGAIHHVDLSQLAAHSYDGWEDKNRHIIAKGPDVSEDSLAIQLFNRTQYVYIRRHNQWVWPRTRVSQLQEVPRGSHSLRGRLQVFISPTTKNSFHLGLSKPQLFIRPLATSLEIRQYRLHARFSDLPKSIAVDYLPKFLTPRERAQLRRVNWLFFTIRVFTPNTTGASAGQ